MRQAITYLLFVTVSITQTAWAADAPSFRFFPADQRVGKNVSAIDWSSAPDAKRFGTALRKAFAEGAKFAGHYALATWGCGSNCQVLAIIDMQNGRVTFGPSTELDYEFRLNSRLLIGNSPSAVHESLQDFGGCPENEDYWAVTSHYYEWTGTGFRHITDVNICAPLNKTPPSDHK